MIKIMTPGPTKVRENVRLARSKATTNPDLDIKFYDEYKNVCNKIGRLLYTKEKEEEIYILSGEGILGLEAACASLTEKDTRVLVIDNGIFGKGFKDFVEIYGGNAVLYTCDYHREIDIAKLRSFLEKDNDFAYATVVHLDTPTGVLNDISKICPLLHEYGILTVVDSVAASFAEEVRIHDWNIDILCGGSQKAVSAPPGLTFVSVSNDAKNYMRNRKSKIASFYANLLIFENYYENKWFPYTMPISDIYGLKVAIDNIEDDKNFIKRHKAIAKAVRNALTKVGLSLYLTSGFADTVTVFNVPKNIKSDDILSKMVDEHSIMLAGCFDILAGKVIRIGHMGENANEVDILDTLIALEEVLKELGFNLISDMKSEYAKEAL